MEVWLTKESSQTAASSWAQTSGAEARAPPPAPGQGRFCPPWRPLRSGVRADKQLLADRRAGGQAEAPPIKCPISWRQAGAARGPRQPVRGARLQGPWRRRRTKPWMRQSNAPSKLQGCPAPPVRHARSDLINAVTPEVKKSDSFRVSTTFPQMREATGDVPLAG